MKKKMKIVVAALSMGVVLVTGKMAFAAESNTSNMSSMMENNSMSNMMKDGNMNKMMDTMNSSERKEMVKSCNKFMESNQDTNSDSDTKDNLKPKGTSTSL